MNSLPIIAIIVSIAGLLFQYFGMIAGIKERLAKIETKVELFWKVVEENIPKLLMRNSTPETDKLVAELTNPEMPETHLSKLKVLLRVELQESKDKAEILAVIMALGRIEQRLFETKRKK